MRTFASLVIVALTATLAGCLAQAEEPEKTPVVAEPTEGEGSVEVKAYAKCCLKDCTHTDLETGKMVCYCVEMCYVK